MAVTHLMYLNGPPSSSPRPTRQALIGGTLAGLTARFLFGRGMIVSNLIGAGVAYMIYKIKSTDYSTVSASSDPVVIVEAKAASVIDEATSVIDEAAATINPANPLNVGIKF